MVEILFVLIIALSLVNIYKSICANEPRLMSYMFWLFCLYFFGIIPLIQYSINIFPWGAKPTIDNILQAQFLILLFQIIYAYSYSKHKHGLNDSAKNHDNHEAIYFKYKKIIISLVILSIIIIVAIIISGLGLTSFFSGREALID